MRPWSRSRNITGITVREMDWKPLLQDRKPALDPLAAHIPFDQHALFFPSFEAMSRWIDEADQDGTPVLQMFEPRAEDANSRGRYQKQLCLELNALSRLIGPQLIASAAFTGSDPYLRTGTDIGVLYETTSPGILKTLLQARQAAAQQANPASKAVKGDIAGVAYTGVVSEDRAVSSYVAALEDVVLVSNSRAQLERLISVAKGKTPALASQDEYRYFRQKISASGLRRNRFPGPLGRHHSTLVRSPMAHRQLPPHSRRRRAGGTPGRASGRIGLRPGQTRLHRHQPARSRRCPSHHQRGVLSHLRHARVPDAHHRTAPDPSDPGRSRRL